MSDKETMADSIARYNKEYKNLILPEWFESHSISNEAIDNGSYFKCSDAFHKRIWGEDYDDQKTCGELNDEIGLSHSDYMIMLCSYLEGAGVARLDFNFTKKELE